jgi:hypothetical protein
VGGAQCNCRECDQLNIAEAVVDQAMSRPGKERDKPKIHPIVILEDLLPAARPKNSRLARERLLERTWRIRNIHGASRAGSSKRHEFIPRAPNVRRTQ